MVYDVNTSPLSNFWTAACSVNYTLLFQTLVAGTEEPWRCKWHQNILYTTGRNKSCEMKFRINHQHLALPGLILFMKHHETLIHGQSFMCSLLRKAVKLFTWAECNGVVQRLSTVESQKVITDFIVASWFGMTDPGRGLAFSAERLTNYESGNWSAVIDRDFTNQNEVVSSENTSVSFHINERLISQLSV